MNRFPFLFILMSLFISTSCPAADEEKTNTPQEYSSVEERRLMVALQQERQNLSQEREGLEEKKKELKRLEDEVDKKLDQLQETRRQIEELLAQKDADELKRLQELSKMYEKMSPEKAARIFSTVDLDLAISILGHMKTKSAARILNNMDREKAAKLTTAFSTLDSK